MGKLLLISGCFSLHYLVKSRHGQKPSRHSKLHGNVPISWNLRADVEKARSKDISQPANEVEHRRKQKQPRGGLFKFHHHCPLCAAHQRCAERVARGETSGSFELRSAHWGCAQSLRTFSAQSKMAPDPDVSRLATFAPPLPRLIAFKMPSERQLQSFSRLHLQSLSRPSL